ncbi:MAG TPA: stage II sporulation protein P [Bacillales bacterium]|nr:stage II sporulation protein P [Bacillales bacterium]
MLSNQPSYSSSLSLKRTSLKRLFILVISTVIALFLFSALLTALDEKFRFASSTVEEWTSSLSSEALLHFIGFENPYFTQVLPEDSHIPPLSSLGFELVTSIEPGDIRSLLGNELPGFEIYDSDIIVAGTGTNYTNLPHESAPPVGVMMQEREVATEKLQKLNEEGQNNDSVTPPVQTTGEKNVVFLYATHNTESYLPILKGADEPNEAYSSKVNMHDVALRLKKELEKRGIGTLVNDNSVQKRVNQQGLRYYQSYSVSRDVVAAALNQHPNVKLVFDLHRDGKLEKKMRMVTLNGKEYARVAFVVGEGNPNYEKNEHKATVLHNMLEDEYPGLSRGVIGKTKKQGNGVYNQDLSGGAMLIEIGGVNNTLKEVYHTMDALADVISEYYWENHEAKKVSGEAE